MPLFNYESEQFFKKAHGDTIPEGKHYEADSKKEILSALTPNYPQLSDYEKEWMYFGDYVYQPGTPVNLEYQSTGDITAGTVVHAIPFSYKSVIFKGSTKYREIETGKILETFNESKNLELVTVKTPILKTVGNNLFDGELESGSFDANTGIPIPDDKTVRAKNFIPVEPNKTYIADVGVVKIYYDKSYNYLSQEVKSSQSFTTPTNCYYMKFRLYYADYTDNNLPKQLEEGSSLSSYEPYKENILSVTDDIELNGIDGVYDEYNALTGELTQRFNRITLNGSEYWQLGTTKTNTQIFFMTLDDGKNVGKIACDKIKKSDGTDSEVVNLTAKLYVGVLKSKATTVAEFKSYLASNPLTLVYELTTVVTKKVGDGYVTKPHEGINHYRTGGETIEPYVNLLIPVISTGKQTLNDINQE